MSDTDINALVERWMGDVNTRGHDRLRREVRRFLGCNCPDTDSNPCTCIADPAVTQDDLVGDAMLNLLEGADKFKPTTIGRADAWACEVIKNCLINSLRASTKQRPDGSEYAKEMHGPTGDTISTEPHCEYERYDHDPEDYYCD